MEKKKLLVVVDMQNDFITGVLGHKNTQAIVPNVVKKVKESIQHNDWIIFTQDTHTVESYSETREGKGLPVPHCLVASEGIKFIPELDFIKDYEDFGVLPKYDTFGLCAHLDPNQMDFTEIEHIEIIGVVTNICVISVAVSLQNALKNTDIVIDASCCASNSQYLHNCALDVMESLQMKVINR